MNIEKSNQQLISELRRDEGVIPYAYQDSLGYLTIGVGRLVDKRKSGGLSDDEIDYLLSNDIQECISNLDKSIPWWRHLTEVRQRVLVNMCFNLGIGSASFGTGLLGFKNTLAMIQTGQYDQAATGMLNSKWARQVGARADRLANMMRSG